MVARGALPSGGPRVSPLRVSGDVSRHHSVSRGQARREVETAARSLGIQSPLLDVRKAEDIGPAFDTASSQRMDALTVQLNTVTQTNRQFIALLAASHRLPAIYVPRHPFRAC